MGCKSGMTRRIQSSMVAWLSVASGAFLAARVLSVFALAWLFLAFMFFFPGFPPFVLLQFLEHEGHRGNFSKGAGDQVNRRSQASRSCDKFPSSVFSPLLLVLGSPALLPLRGNRGDRI